MRRELYAQSLESSLALEVGKLLLDAEPVAALVAAERAAVDAHVVARVAVGEAVDQELVDDLVAPVVDVCSTPSQSPPW